MFCPTCHMRTTWSYRPKLGSEYSSFSDMWRHFLFFCYDWGAGWDGCKRRIGFESVTLHIKRYLITRKFSKNIPRWKVYLHPWALFCKTLEGGGSLTYLSNEAIQQFKNPNAFYWSKNLTNEKLRVTLHSGKLIYAICRYGNIVQRANQGARTTCASPLF